MLTRRFMRCVRVRAIRHDPASLPPRAAVPEQGWPPPSAVARLVVPSGLGPPEVTPGRLQDDIGRTPGLQRRGCCLGGGAPGVWPSQGQGVVLAPAYDQVGYFNTLNMIHSIK